MERVWESGRLLRTVIYTGGDDRAKGVARILRRQSSETLVRDEVDWVEFQRFQTSGLDAVFIHVNIYDDASTQSELRGRVGERPPVIILCPAGQRVILDSDFESILDLPADDRSVLYAVSIALANDELAQMWRRLQLEFEHHRQATLAALGNLAAFVVAEAPVRDAAGVAQAAESLVHEARRLRGVSACFEDICAVRNGGETRVLDITAISREVAARVMKSAPHPSGVIEVEDGISATAAEGPARVVLENLIANAWKYSSKAERPLVRVKSVRHIGHGGVFVSDNGIGLAVEQANSLFRPFVRQHQGFQGTGVGLAIVRNALERDGGRIWIQSEKGQGATFFVNFGRPDSDASSALATRNTGGVVQSPPR